MKKLPVRKLPARIGASIIVLHGEGYTMRTKGAGPNGERPRAHCRFLAGEFGTISAIEEWFGERRYCTVLPPHPDWPEEGPREYWLHRDDFQVLPIGTPTNTSAMDNHWRGIDPETGEVQS